jgi:hypothetical protein
VSTTALTAQRPPLLASRQQAGFDPFPRSLARPCPLRTLTCIWLARRFMSLVRKHPIVRDSPAPEKKAAELNDTEASGVWDPGGADEGDGDDDLDMYESASPRESDRGE